MRYQYRWAYAGICVLTVSVSGYWFDLQSLFSERERLVSAIRSADMKAVRAPSVELKPEIVTTNLSADFSVLSKLLQRYHLQLEDVRQADTGSSGNADQTIQVSGEYDEVHQFLAALAICTECRVSELVPTAKSAQRVLAALHLELPADIQFVNLSTIAKPAMNPFCGADKPVKNNHVREAVFDSIRLLGSVTEADKRSAVLALPDGVMSVVMVGDELGREGGRVIDITEDKVKVLFPDHSQREIL